MTSLPIEDCPICLQRIRPGEVTIRDNGDSIHADPCWPIVCSVRQQTDAGVPVAEAINNAVVDDHGTLQGAKKMRSWTGDLLVHRRGDVWFRVIEGGRS